MTCTVYLYGGHFTLFTDCKPVQLIFSNEKSKPPARIERWNLRLQGYNFSVVHTQGSENPSDFLSRHPMQGDLGKQEAMAEVYVNFISNHAVLKAMSLSEIKQATRADNTLQCIAELIRSNQWHSIGTKEGVSQDELRLFKQDKDELTVNSDSDVILRGNHIIIPTTLHYFYCS